MKRAGTRNNLIKNIMKLLAQDVSSSRIGEAIKILNQIEQYDFKPNASVYFYYDEFIDDVMFLTENNNEVDWDASIVVEIKLSNNPKEGFGVAVYYD